MFDISARLDKRSRGLTQWLLVLLCWATGAALLLPLAAAGAATEPVDLQICAVAIVDGRLELEVRGPAADPGGFQVEGTHDLCQPYSVIPGAEITAAGPERYRVTMAVDEARPFVRLAYHGALAWSDDFSMAEAEGPPRGWTANWVNEPAAWRVVDRAGTRQLELRPQGSGYHVLQFDRAGAVADVEILALVESTLSAGGTQNRLLVRMSGSAGNETGYALDLRNGTIRIWRFLNGATSGVGDSVNTGWSGGVSTWMRFRAEGTSLMGRVWPAGAPEPEAWSIVREDSAIAGPGSVGIGGWSNEGIRFFDYASVGIAGSSPPVPVTLPQQPFRLMPRRAEQPMAAEALFAFDASHSFQVGRYGVVAHFDGDQWMPYHLSTGRPSGHFYGVWGSAPDNVWAVGGWGIHAHWNGQEWRFDGEMPGSYLQAGIWGSGADNIWSVGSGGRAFRYDGSAWSLFGTLPTGGNTLRGIWGHSANAIVAVGDGGSAVIYDGSEWTAMTNASSAHLYGVWGTGPNQFVAVGAGGTILRYQGGSWQPDPTASGVTSADLRSVHGFGPDDIYAVGESGVVLHFDGRGWYRIQEPAVWGHNYYAVKTTSDGALLVGGYDGGTLEGRVRTVDLGQPKHPGYEVRRLADPDRHEVYDATDQWIATYTLGSFTVTYRGAHRVFHQNNATIAGDIWARMLPVPFDGRIDFAHLDEMRTDPSPDLLAIGAQYLDGVPPIYSGGIQLAGDSGYGEGIGSDFRDYLGITYVYSSGSIVSPRESRFLTMDCSGYLRMAFGYRGSPYRIPFGTGGLPRTSNDQFFYGHGTVIIPYADAKPDPAMLARLMPGDAVFFKSSDARDVLINHVGYYIGRDQNNRMRFIHSLSSYVDGPRFDVSPSLYVLDGNTSWPGYLRAVRRF